MIRNPPPECKREIAIFKIPRFLSRAIPRSVNEVAKSGYNKKGAHGNAARDAREIGADQTPVKPSATRESSFTLDSTQRDLEQRRQGLPCESRN